LPCRRAALSDDLIEPLVQLCQRIRNLGGRTLIDAARTGAPPVRACVPQAFKLLREFVETIIDRREVVAERAAVVVTLSV
jgi:hypothetical protein